MEQRKSTQLTTPKQCPLCAIGSSRLAISAVRLLACSRHSALGVCCSLKRDSRWSSMHLVGIERYRPKCGLAENHSFELMLVVEGAASLYIIRSQSIAAFGGTMFHCNCGKAANQQQNCETDKAVQRGGS